jgi:hypothetical protein
MHMHVWADSLSTQHAFDLYSLNSLQTFTRQDGKIEFSHDHLECRFGSCSELHAPSINADKDPNVCFHL